MSYLPITLPAQEGDILLSEDNFKQWVYVTSNNNDPNKTKLVGRWVLVRATQDPNLPGGGGGSSSNIKFKLGNVIVPEETPGVNASGEVVNNVKHDIDFGLIEDLPEYTE